MWYPTLDGKTCTNNGDMPSWMLDDSYVPYYLFTTLKQCCAVWCTGIIIT